MSGIARRDVESGLFELRLLDRGPLALDGLRNVEDRLSLISSIIRVDIVQDGVAVHNVQR